MNKLFQILLLTSIAFLQNGTSQCTIFESCNDLNTASTLNPITSNKISSNLNDTTPRVHAVNTDSTFDYFLEIIVPIAGDSYLENELVLEVFTLNSFISCEGTDLHGVNENYNFQVISRSHGIGDDPFQPNEKVVFEVTFPFMSNSEYLHSITPIIGEGWIVDTTYLIENPPIDDLGIISEFNPDDDECGTYITRDFDFFCSYKDDNGITKICNMLTHRCPCEDNPLKAESMLGPGWTFTTSSSICETNCSPSSTEGIGSFNSSIFMQLKLTVDSESTNFGDLQFGLLTLSDGYSGCWNTAFPCDTPIAVWSPLWSKVNPSKTYGSIALSSDTYCYGEEIEVSTTLNRVDESDVEIRFDLPQGVSYTGGDIMITNDTIVNLNILNETDSIIQIQLNLYNGEIGWQGIISSKTVTLLPKLKLSTNGNEVCNGTCRLVEITNNHNANYITRIASTGTILSLNSVFLCPNETISVFVDEGVCGSDTFDVFTIPTDEIEVYTTMPDRICTNLLFETTPIYKLSLDSITGGSPPYEITVLGETQYLFEIDGTAIRTFQIFEESILEDSLKVAFRVSSLGNCITTKDFDIPITKTQNFDLGDFCKDGWFEPNNPEILLELDVYGEPIEDYQWFNFLDLDAMEDIDGNYVINEETSDYLDDVVENPIFADIKLDDNCTVRSIFDFSIYNNSRSFNFEITDFEVDFIPTNVQGINSISWDFGDGNTNNDIFATHIYEEVGSFEVTMVIEDDCDTRTVNKTITIEGPVTVNEIETTVQIFPNPSSGEFQIRLDNFYDNIDLAIYDVQGRKVKAEIKASSSKVYTVNMNAGSEGFYILHLSLDGKNFYKKLIVD